MRHLSVLSRLKGLPAEADIMEDLAEKLDLLERFQGFFIALLEKDA